LNFQNQLYLKYARRNFYGLLAFENERVTRIKHD